MKRKTSVDGSSSSSSSSRSPVREGEAPTRVTKIEQQLRANGVLPDRYPARGRVLAYLTDENHVHDPRDEPDLIDWCVNVGASSLLGDVLSQWRRSSVHLQNSEVAQVLTAGVTAALNAGARHIAVVRCIPGPHSNEDDNHDLVLVLVRVASECDALTLEDFRLLRPEEVCQFLDFACGRCSLTQLSLSRVSGMDAQAMERLVPLLLTSGILSLCLGEVDPDVLKGFLAALLQWSEGVCLPLKCLDISYTVAGDSEGRMTAKARQQSEEIELQVALLKDRHPGLEVKPTRTLIMPDDRPRGSESGEPPQDHSFNGLSLTMLVDGPMTPPDRQLEPNPAYDVLECFETDKPPEPHPTHRGIEWNPRVLRRPGFLADIGLGLGALWLTEESIPRHTMEHRLQTLIIHSPRIAYALTDSEPSRLQWIRQLNQEHRSLWDDTYARHLKALIREDTLSIAEMEVLLREGKTFELIDCVQRLHARRQLPGPDQITSLLERYQDNPALRTVGLWVFNPLQAIDELIDEGRIEQLHTWANALRRVDALPTPRSLQPLLDRYADWDDVMQALLCFLP